MANLSTDSMNKANGAASDLKSQFLSSEAQIEKLAQNAGKAIGKMSSDIADTASGYVTSSRDYVQDNPGKSIAIAAAAGLVAGGLLTMALRRRS